jgi:hypothetical protein
MKRVSYSQYTMWSNCGLSWKLKYVDGHKFDDASIHTIFGTVCHEVIQDWLDILYNKSETIAKTVYLHDTFKEKLLALFKEHTALNEHGEKIFLSDKKTLMEFYEQGCKILSYIQDNYKKIFPTANVKLYGIEVELNRELRPGVNYIGYIDIVTHNTVTNKYVLYDLKTTRTGWTQDQKTDPKKTGQLLLYKRFFSQQCNIPEDDISVEFVMLKRIIPENTTFHIPQVSKFEPPNKNPSMKKAWGLFEEFLNTAFDSEGQYVTEQTPKPSKENCRWCVFRDKKDLCQYGVK